MMYKNIINNQGSVLTLWNEKLLIQAIVALLVLLKIPTVTAQDIHFSQYFNVPVLINPALTGDFKNKDSKARFNAGYKNQWNSVNGNPYSTFTVSGEGVFMKEKLSLGLICYNDRSGDALLNTTQIQATIATRIAVDKHNDIRFGLLGGWSQSSIDLNKLTWNSQYDGKIFNSEVPSGEITYRQNRYLDIWSGMTWKHEFDNNAEWNAGLSASHVNRPQYNVLSVSDKLHIRWNAYADLSIIPPPTVNISYHPSLLFIKQGSLTETDMGMYIKYRLGQHSLYTGENKNSNLSLGVYYRVNDAIIGYFRYDYKERFACALSYDFTISKFTPATKVFGSSEIVLVYYVTNRGVAHNLR